VYGAFRYRGDTVVVLTVKAEDATLSVVMPVAAFDFTPGSTWATAVGPADIDAVSQFTDVDFRRVSRVRVEVLAADFRTHRLRCTCGVAQVGHLTVEAAFTFCGTRDHDGGSWWRHLVEQYALGRQDGPLTEFEWLHTDRLRRVCRELYYPIRPPAVPHPAAPPPPPSPAGWLRRLLGRRTAAPAHVPPSTRPAAAGTQIRPTARQTKLLVTALAEHHLKAPELARLYERYADGEETDDDRARVRHHDGLAFQPGMVDVGAADNLLNARAVADHPSELFQLLVMEGGYQDLFVWRLVPERSTFGCDALRDILGNPFRPTPVEPAWRTESTVGLARAIYGSTQFDVMTVLADALEEAGCADPTVLAHCRNPNPHVRGCWVLDGLLARDTSRITIQSSSPRTSEDSLPGSVPRFADTAVSVAPRDVSRVLGRGGSSSLMIRRISSNAALRKRSPSNGVVPVSSS
jgi:hypothetical protein